MRRQLVLLFTTLAVAACATITVGTPGPTGAVAERAAAQRLVWDAQHIRTYTFTIERQCFCPPDFGGPFEVTVVEGAPTLVTFQGGVALADRVQDLPKTMEAVFNVVFQNAATEPLVVYDDRFGFPLRIGVDPIPNAIDDEFTIVVSNFRPADG